MSPDASIGYGIDLGGSEMGYHESLEAPIEAAGEDLGTLLDDLDAVFGFDEEFPHPAAQLLELSYDEREKHPAFIAFRANMDDWRRRRDRAIPVEGESYGYVDYAGWVLITKRSYQRVNWGCEPIGMKQMFVPHVYETDGLNKVLDHLGYTGEREFRWLLWASYG